MVRLLTARAWIWMGSGVSAKLRRRSRAPRSGVLDKSPGAFSKARKGVSLKLRTPLEWDSLKVRSPRACSLGISFESRRSGAGAAAASAMMRRGVAGWVVPGTGRKIGAAQRPASVDTVVMDQAPNRD